MRRVGDWLVRSADRIAVGVIAVAIAGILIWQGARGEPPPAAPSALNTPLPTPSVPMPPSVTFSSGGRSIQMPALVVRRAAPDLGAIDQLGSPPPGGGLLLALARTTNQPLRTSGAPGWRAAYVGVDGRVIHVAPLDPPQTAALAPYAVALLTPAGTPYALDIAAGDAAALPPGVVVAPADPQIVVPAKGPLTGYPGGNTTPAPPRPTAPGGYPGQP